jgi:hypothetical protein
VKVKHKEPSASPVIPTIAETSPTTDASFLRYGVPGTGWTDAMVVNTVIVDSKNGLINSAFMSIKALS